MRTSRFVSLFLFLASAFVSGSSLGHDERPTAEQTQPWRATSFLEDADLQGRGIFFFDFEQDGTVWIAASDGLYRYDGYRWDRYTSAHGLPSDYVRSVLVTREGKLWVGTDRGAGIFDGKTFDPAGTQGNLAGPSVRRIVEDPDGTLWFCCDQWPPADVEAGLTRYRAGEWKTWRSKDGLPSDYVSDVFTDRQGVHFVLTRGGLARFDGDRLVQPFVEAGLPECQDYIWSMVETSEGHAIATTTDWLCVRKNGQWTKVPNRSPRIGLPQLTVTRDGKVLACTSEPSARFLEWVGDRFVPIWTADVDTRGTVQYIGESPGGAIWIAGTNVLARWERLGGEWKSFDDLPPPRLEDTEGGIWFSDSRRVLRLKDDRWTDVPDASDPLTSGSSGEIWMHTSDGLARWTTSGTTRFGENAIGVTKPRDAMIDGAGDLWVVGRGPGGRERLARFDGEDWTPREMTGVESNERIVFSAPDSRRGMWYVLENPETDRYRLIRVNDTETVNVPLPLPAQRFWVPKVMPDRAGRLWLFGLLGLYRRDLDADVPEWEQVDELLGKQVLNVVTRQNEVWFSYLGVTGGSGGITRLLDGSWDHFSSAARNLSSRAGDDALFFTHPRGAYVVARNSAEPPRLLALPESTWVESLVAGPRGDLWIGTHSQVYHFQPDGIPPETLIVHGEREIVHGEDLLLEVRGVERFKPLAYRGNFKVAVQLDDQPWGEFEPLLDGRVTVINIPTGDHVARVRVQDQGLDVDPSPAVWRFRLHPVPLQNRGWFGPLVIGTAMTVVLLVLLSFATRRREVEQRGKKQELERDILRISEREQRRIGRDLHDGLGQRLTSISFQCEALRGMVKRGDADSVPRVQEIGAAVRTAISETRVLAHALYPAEVENGDLRLALGNLVSAIDSGFDGTCTYRHGWSPEDLSRDDALNIYRLVQEALGNAIRHSGARTLHVDLRRDKADWIIEVRDDGRGFDARDLVEGLGLQIMRYRADRIGGTLIVDSRPARGTTIRCVIRR